MYQRYKGIFIFIFTMCLLSIPFNVFGHSKAISYSPAPNSSLEQPPTTVTIKFQSEIDDHLYSLKVFNEQQQEVNEMPATLDSSRKELSVWLPQLSEGLYTVQYSIVSNDGHPQQESYSFSVRALELNQTPSSDHANDLNQAPSSDRAPELNQSPSESINLLNSNDFFIYLIRGLYYFGFLWIVGWVFWKQVLKQKGKIIPEKYKQWGLLAQMAHLFGLVSMILVQVIDITGNGIIFSPEIPFTSFFMMVWIGSIFLSLAGVILLFKSKWLDLLWLLSILILKALSGHSSDFEPISLLIGINTIHLMGAAIWCSGLIFILIYWKKQRVHVYDFLPIFSFYALLSLIILILSGTALSIIYLPDVHSLFTTQWGWILIVKLIAVTAVAFVGIIVRKKMKRTTDGRLKNLLVLDFLLMVSIIGLVAVLTYI